MGCGPGSLATEARLISPGLTCGMLIGDSRGNPSQAKRRAANQLWKQGHWTEVILLRSEWLENYTVGQAVGRQSGC